MTTRRPCPPAPGPLEDYAQRFDSLFSSLAQRRGFRDYLQGLLLPRDRNKTLTGLAGAEPIIGAQHREVQRLQWFLSESAWDHQQVNAQRVQLLCEDPATAPHERGALVIDDTGDRKDGTATAHVARQYLGSVGKIDNGIVAVTSLWADERVYWPVHAVPYTPASRLPRWRADPGFRTKPQLAVELVQAARTAKIPFRAVVADCFYGDNPGFTDALTGRQGPVRAGPQAPQGHLGAGRGRPHPGRGGRRARLARPESAWAVAPGHPPLPRRAHRDLVGGRCDPWRLGPGSAAAAGGGHHRPGQAARPQQLVPADQPAPPQPAAAPSRPTWPRWCACTGCATGSSRATSRSKASSAGPTSRSAPTGPSAAIGRWCAARSPSAGRLVLAEQPDRPDPPNPQAAAPTAARGADDDRASTPNPPSEAPGRWRCGRCGPG